MSKTRRSKKYKARRRRLRRRYSKKKRGIRRHKKGGAPINIQPGDILVMNFGGRVPLPLINMLP